MRLFIEKTNQKKEISFEGSVKQLLLKIKINPEEVIVIKNNELVGEDENIIDKDQIRILSVISGG